MTEQVQAGNQPTTHEDLQVQIAFNRFLIKCLAAATLVVGAASTVAVGWLATLAEHVKLF